MHREPPPESAEQVVDVRSEQKIHFLRVILAEGDPFDFCQTDFVVRSMEVVTGLAIRQEEERQRAAAVVDAGQQSLCLGKGGQIVARREGLSRAEQADDFVVQDPVDRLLVD